VTPSRDEIARDIQQLIVAGQELRDLIRESRKGLQKGLELLDRGVGLDEAMRTLNAAERRLLMTDHIAEFEERRHQLRLSITVAALEEGMSIGDIARAFGVSRQLASRMAKQARGEG
jgi:hypothetical protein